MRRSSSGLLSGSIDQLARLETERLRDPLEDTDRRVVTAGLEVRDVRRKIELALRLLRGEALDAVSRESQVPGHELESWRWVCLETGTRALKSPAEPEERELTLARAKILLEGERNHPLRDVDADHAGADAREEPHVVALAAPGVEHVAAAQVAEEA